jgi:PhzF family phenazine biosynthesis protein
MKTRPYQVLDVFTSVPYMGNPLAVVLDGSDLTTAQMQQYAKWTNLSETTFVLPPTQPGADYAVRIFTPGGELPFAGHPTLGTCDAWLSAGGVPKLAGMVIQECAVGLVTISNTSARRAFVAPPFKRSAPAPSALAQVCSALGLRASQLRVAQMLDVGTPWLALLVDSPQTLLSLTPEHTELKKIGIKVGAAAVYESRTDAQLEVRVFAAATGVNEDPATGSLNALLGQWLIADGLMPRTYVAAQGSAMGRDARISIRAEGEAMSEKIWVGGDVVRCISGTVNL